MPEPTFGALTPEQQTALDAPTDLTPVASDTINVPAVLAPVARSAFPPPEAA